MAKHAAVQMDMLDAIEQIDYEQQPIICLYRSTARGLAARAADIDTTPRRVHAWSIYTTCPTKRTTRCQATVLSADTRRYSASQKWPACGCEQINELMYRGACLGIDCDWEGEPHPLNENAAVEDAMDHAWPGWRDVPIVPRVPFAANNATEQKWLNKVTPLYPEGWIENGGPIRTQREKYGTRHHGPAIPCGGYDMGVPAPEQEDTQS